MRLNATYIINNERISIATENTSWINLARINEIFTKEDLLKLYKEVDQSAKSANIKVGYSNHYKKTILESYDDYASDVKKSHELYEELKQLAANVRITPCTEENPELDFLMKKRDEYSELLYHGDTPYWKIRHVVSELTRLKEEIQRQTEHPVKSIFYKLTKIYI